MRKRTSVILLLSALTLVFISVGLLVLSILNSTRTTGIEADIKGVSTAYIDDATNSLYAFDGSLKKRSFDGSTIADYSLEGIADGDTVSGIDLRAGYLYASLVNQKAIVRFDEATCEANYVYRLLDPVTKFTVSEKNEYLAVASKNKGKTYLTLLNAKADESALEAGYQTPYLCEIEYSSEIVSLYFEGEELVYALKNGDVYRLSAQGELSPKRIFRTELTLIAYGNVKSGAQVAVSDKGIIAYYDNGELISSLELGKDVYCASVCENSELVAIGLRYDKLHVYSAESKSIIAKIPVFNEPKVIDRSGEGADRIFIYEPLSGSGKIVDLSSAKKVQIFNALKIVGIVAVVLSGLFLIYSIVNISRAGKKAQELYVKFGKTVWKHKKSYLMLLPTFIMLGIFNFFPAIWSFFLAFTEYKPGVYTRFVGFSNFTAMFQNEYFWVGMGNMGIFLVTDLLKALIPPLIIAELILAMRSTKARYWTRVLMYIPGILPGVAGVMIWTAGILGMDGLVNVFLRTVGLGHLAVDWLGTPQTALWALVFIGFPYVGGYLLFYGAIMSVPKELYEAATLDGCGWWQRIVHIDIPLISPQLKYVFVTGFIGSIQDFGRVWLTTKGGPGYSTYIPALELYNNISQFNNYGMAAAMGLFLFVIILVITIFNMKIKTQSAVGD